MKGRRNPGSGLSKILSSAGIEEENDAILHSFHESDAHSCPGLAGNSTGLLSQILSRGSLFEHEEEY